MSDIVIGESGIAIRDASGNNRIVINLDGPSSIMRFLDIGGEPKIDLRVTETGRPEVSIYGESPANHLKLTWESDARPNHFMVERKSGTTIWNGDFTELG